MTETNTQQEAILEAPSTDLVLQAPKPVAAVTPEQAVNSMNLSPEELEKVQETVTEFTKDLASLAPHSAEWAQKVRDIETIGSKEIRTTGQASNRLLQKTIRDMKKTDEGKNVSSGLVDLRHTIDDLDPAKSSALNGFVASLPFVNKMRRYFHQYEKSQTQINSILESLNSGREELMRDNAAIDQERDTMWDSMERLRQHIEVTAQVDRALVGEIEAIRDTDPDRARQMEQEFLFPARQRHQDLMTHLAVTGQGYLALEIIKHNNKELIRGVKRASETTVTALQTAVMVANAMGTSKMVLGQITALNATTEGLIRSTAEALHQHTTEVSAQAMSSGVGVETIQFAFDKMYASLDVIENYKTEALGNMELTIKTIDTEMARARKTIEKSHDHELPSGSSKNTLEIEG